MSQIIELTITCVGCGKKITIQAPDEYVDWYTKKWESGNIPGYECPECLEEAE